MILSNIEQGTADWLALRKKHITGTDAAIVMGLNPWRTKTQLYHEKLSNEPPMQSNEAMERGTRLEPVARSLFMIKSGINFEPQVLIKDWAMASLDGLSLCGKYVLEIKCPKEKTHAVALAGKVPEYYYPQLQHQMYVSGVQLAFYFSFDGFDGVAVEVKRNDEFIEKMLVEEKKFYDCLMSKTPPEVPMDEYKVRSDNLWSEYAFKRKTISNAIKELEKEEKELDEKLIHLAGGSNTKGAGISLCKIERKGTVDYAKVPELKGVDLEQYRKPSSTSWRVTCS